MLACGQPAACPIVWESCSHCFRAGHTHGTYDLLFCGHTLDWPESNCPSCAARRDLHDAEGGMHVISSRHFHGGAGAANRAWSPPSRHDVITGKFGRRDNALEAGQRLNWLEAVRQVTGVDPRELRPHNVDRHRRSSRAIERAGGRDAPEGDAGRAQAHRSYRAEEQDGCWVRDTHPRFEERDGRLSGAASRLELRSPRRGQGRRRVARPRARPGAGRALQALGTRGAAQGKRPRGWTPSTARVAGALTGLEDALMSVSRATVTAIARHCEMGTGTVATTTTAATGDQCGAVAASPTCCRDRVPASDRGSRTREPTERTRRRRRLRTGPRWLLWGPRCRQPWRPRQVSAGGEDNPPEDPGQEDAGSWGWGWWNANTWQASSSDGGWWCRPGRDDGGGDASTAVPTDCARSPPTPRRRSVAILPGRSGSRSSSPTPRIPPTASSEPPARGRGGCAALSSPTKRRGRPSTA